MSLRVEAVSPFLATAGFRTLWVYQSVGVVYLFICLFVYVVCKLLTKNNIIQGIDNKNKIDNVFYTQMSMIVLKRNRRQ